MEKKKIVAGYCRVSTLEQKKKGYGIDIQLREITKYAEMAGIRIGNFYLDEAKSGASENRRALKRLIRDCRTGKIEAVVISSLDRLFRNLRFTENLLYEVNNLGVRVLITDMPHYDGANRKDVLIRQIREAIAEENRKDIIERLKKGREERTRKGKIAGGTLPYGYMRNSKEIKKNPREAEIIRLIFSFDGSKSGQEIAEYLNARGHKRRNGTEWTQRQVWAVLSRADLYRKGVIKYGEVRAENQELIIV